MNQYSKIKTLSFSGLRRLNPFNCFAEGRELLDIWHNTRDIYELGDINVFAGRNGAGKSTILDLVEFLGNPKKLCTLPRENRRSSSHSFINLTVSNGSSLLAAIVPNEIIEHGVTEDSLQDHQFAQLVVQSPNQRPRGFSENIGKKTLSTKHENDIREVLAPLKCHITSWNRDADLAPHILAEVLNSIDCHLAGLEADPYAPLESGPMFDSKVFTRPVFMVNQHGMLSAYLSDDRVQSSNLSLPALPSGCKRPANPS